MNAPRASVIIVSRGRPDTLCLCLAGVARLRNAAYEVIVVADPAGIEAARGLDFAPWLKLLTFDRPNISVARNLGLIEAAGEVAAFIDDDAVPEPRWLEHLLAAFALPDVAVAGGYVRGRNGISFQWRARSIDAEGFATGLRLAGDDLHLPQAPEGQAIKTEGTNMAIRRSLALQLGGFDPAYPFYMDETDLNMRLARAGHRTAIAPLAQVHHAYAPSPRRSADRAVRGLRDIGASHMVFARRHGADPGHVRERVRAEQRRRLVAQLIDGRIEPRDLARLTRDLDDGFTAGLERPLPSLRPLVSANRPFVTCPGLARGGVRVLAGRPWQARRLRAEAASLAAAGETVSLFLFSPKTVYHKVRFQPEGYWLQAGGLWGRSTRNAPLIQPVGFAKRVRREVARNEAIR